MFSLDPKTQENGTEKNISEEWNRTSTKQMRDDRGWKRLHLTPGVKEIKMSSSGQDLQSYRQGSHGSDWGLLGSDTVLPAFNGTTAPFFNFLKTMSKNYNLSSEL
jgi:hypothetical protein